MTRIIKIAAFLFIFLFASASHAAGFWERYEKNPLPKIDPPKTERVRLPNGIECFLLEDHSLPMVHIEIIARTGGIYEPAAKVGLSELTGMLMRTGGAGGLSPANFDRAVDDLGANLSSGIGAEMGIASLEVLSEDLRTGVKLLFDMLFTPGFDEGRMKVARHRIEEGLRRENDDPDSLATKEFRQFVYGRESPWARRPDSTTLSSINIKDIEAFHGKYFKANNLIMAASGDFNSRELQALVMELTGNAPHGDVSFPNVPEVTLSFEPGVRQITRKKTQSFIRMGHLGIKRSNPDKFALMLMNDILGAGNFKSRLMNDIRTNRGMAYSIWSKMTPTMDYGLFLVGVDTKSVQAADVIGLVRDHILKLSEGKDVTDDELEFARQSVLSQLIFEFDSAFKVVDRSAAFYYYGYPANYWKIFRDQIASIDREEVENVAKKYLRPDGLKIVVVGPKIEGLK